MSLPAAVSRFAVHMASVLLAQIEPFPDLARDKRDIVLTHAGIAIGIDIGIGVAQASPAAAARLQQFLSSEVLGGDPELVGHRATHVAELVEEALGE